MERLSVRVRERIAELLAEGAPPWRLREEIHRSRHAIRRAVWALQRPPARAPKRSPLRLSLVEGEEISRGLAAGESGPAIGRPLGGRHRPSRGRSDVMAVFAVIGRLERTGMLASDGSTETLEAGVVSSIACGGGSDLSCVGLRPRSPVGWWRGSVTIRRCGCRTKRSICRCSCSRAARCAKNSPAICGIA
jgi:hypothetical protein